MTIPAGTPNRNDYVGNDTLAIYPFTFPIQSQDQLQVSVLEVSSGTTTQLVYDTDYTVTGEGNPTGGNVELVNISQAWLDANTGFLNTGYNMVIRMYPGLAQGTSISNGGPYYEESVEDALDSLTMQDLEQQDEIDRSFKIPATENPASFTLTVPAALQRALMGLGFDANGNLTVGASFAPFSAFGALLINALSALAAQPLLNTLNPNGVGSPSGGGQSGANPITAIITSFEVVNSGDEVTLVGTTYAIGNIITVINKGSNALKVYPPVGDTINALGANNPYSVSTAGTGTIRFIKMYAGKWFAM